MAKIKKEQGNFGSFPGIGDQSEKYTYKTPGNKGIFSRELGNKQKFKREQGNMYPLKRPSAMFLKCNVRHCLAVLEKKSPSCKFLINFHKLLRIGSKLISSIFYRQAYLLNSTPAHRKSSWSLIFRMKAKESSRKSKQRIAVSFTFAWDRIDL